MAIVVGADKAQQDEHLHSLLRMLRCSFESDDMDNFEMVFKKWSENPNFQIEIRTIIGGTTDSPLLRFDSYLVAPLELLRNLNDLKDHFESHGGVQLTTPQLTLGSAHTMAALVNNDSMSADSIHDCALQMLQRANQFVNRYFPDVSDQVAIVHDTEATWNNSVVQHWMDAAAMELSGTPIAHKFQQMGSRHGGERGADKSALYAAAHCLVHGDIVHGQHLEETFHRVYSSLPWSCIAESGLDPELVGIISVGGSPERMFNEARAFLASVATDRESRFVAMPHHARLISVAGHKPVYYHLDGDLSFANAAQHANLTEVLKLCTKQHVKSDFKVLKRFYLADLAKRSGFSSCEELCYALFVVLTHSSESIPLDPTLLVQFDQVAREIGIVKTEFPEIAQSKKLKFDKEKLWKIVKQKQLQAESWAVAYGALTALAKLSAKTLNVFQERLQDELHRCQLARDLGME
jgi:hypothetical protein